MTYPSTATRICDYCLQRQPLSEFRLRCRNKPARTRECRGCHNARERARRHSKQTSRIEKSMRSCFSNLEKADAIPKVDSILENVVGAVGGARRFVELWQQLIVRDIGKGGYRAFRHFQAILKLAQYCESQRPDYSQFTEEELEAAVRELAGSG